MSGAFYLAWRYVRYHRAKSLILMLCLSLTLVLPLVTQLVIWQLDRELRARAAATPLVVGAIGNRFDLVLKALYFGSAKIAPVSMADVDELAESALALPIPLALDFTARGYRLVGTTLEYLDFRGLRVAQGTPPLRLGQCVVGATLAAELALGPGDALFSDQRSLYDITRTYPLKMRIAGVLAPSGTPDDRAVFVDLKTLWIVAGISHGHQDVSHADEPAIVLSRTAQEVKTNAAIVEFTRGHGRQHQLVSHARAARQTAGLGHRRRAARREVGDDS